MTHHGNWPPRGENAINSKSIIKEDMDRNMIIRLILTKILTNEEDKEMYRNSENPMAIALWEGFARTYLTLKC